MNRIPRHRFGPGETEMQVLREAEPLIRHLLSSQWPQPGTDDPQPAEVTGRIAERIGAKVAGFGSGRLTAREAEVVRPPLRGVPSGAIAKALGISAATVKIPRRNRYAKLDISSQGELFAAFLDRLAGPGA